MSKTLSRRWFGLAVALAAAFTFVTPARADKAAEAYVASSAPAALAALSEPGLTAQERQAKFGQLMENFADLNRISEFVLGRYARNLRTDRALQQEWRATFRDYAVAVYQDQLDQYRGTSVRIVPGSRDATINGRFYSVVTTELAVRGREPFVAQWRLLRDDATGRFQVVDVAVKLQDQVIWLATQQRQDFLAFLDQNNGDVRALIAEVKRQTSMMRTRIAQREGGRRS